jgi:hypothetical protein
MKKNEDKGKKGKVRIKDKGGFEKDNVSKKMIGVSMTDALEGRNKDIDLLDDEDEDQG